MFLNVQSGLNQVWLRNGISLPVSLYLEWNKSSSRMASDARIAP